MPELVPQRPITGAEPIILKRLNARNQTNHKDRASTENITKLAAQLATTENPFSTSFASTMIRERKEFRILNSCGGGEME